MQNIKSISLLCENLSEITLEPKDVELLNISGLTGQIQKISDEFQVIDVCTQVAMVIRRDANQIMQHPFGEYGSMFNMLNTDHCIFALRVESDDETGIVYVPWDGDLENLYMDTKLTEDGDLLIVINEEETVESVFGCWNHECHCC